MQGFSRNYEIWRMKIHYLIHAVLAIAVAVLFYLHFNTNRATAPANNNSTAKRPITTPAPKIEMKASPIVFINADSLMENYTLVKRNRNSVEQERKKFETQFEAKYKALEQEFNSLRDRAETISQDEGMLLQQHLMLKEQELGKFREENLTRLDDLERKKAEEIQKGISGYLRNTYANSRYAYILGYSAGGGILFAHDSLDITNEVIQGLNAERR